MKRFDYISVPLSGSNIIEASAGTGKTYSIAGIFLRLILEKDMTVDRILVVTFTDAATSELRDRIRRRLVDARSALSAESYDELPDPLENEYIEHLFSHFDPAQRKELAQKADRAITCFDESAISTIHSFCQRVLRENAFEYGSLFNAELITDQSVLIEEIQHDFLRTRLYSMPPELIDDLKDLYLGGTLSSAIEQALSKPLARVAARKVTEKTILAAGRAVADAFAAAADIWHGARDDIEKTLVTSSSFDKGFISRAPGYCETVDAVMRAGNPAAGFDATCAYLGNIYLDGKCDKAGKERVSHPFFGAWQRFLDARSARDAALAGYAGSISAEFIAFARTELVRRKSERNVWSFDDLLSRVYDGLTHQGGDRIAKSVLSRFHAALVDEFQDTDRMQCRIFDAIFNTDGALLFYIGDPKQAIYSFRGADIDAYEDAKNSVLEKYSLDTNWRSAGGLIDAVNAFFSVNNPFLAGDGIGFSPATAGGPAKVMTEKQKPAVPFVVWTVAGKDEKKPLSKERARDAVSSAVAEEIARILTLSDSGEMQIDGKKIRPGDIAVVVEKNSHSEPLRAALSERGIPSVSSDSRTIYATDECLDIERFVKAVSDHRYIPASLVSGLIGVDPHDLASAMADDAAWNDILAEFAQYARLWDEGGFMRMFRSFLARRTILESCVSRNGGVRSVANILHCAECIHRAAAEQGLSRPGVQQWLASVREDPSSGIEKELRLETDEDAVTIITVHKSKGLEFPIVFVPFSWDSPGVFEGAPLVYHDEKKQQVIDCTRKGVPSYDESYCAAEFEHLGEQLRLLYVAMTRAKYRCYLAVGKIGTAEGYPGSAAAYLLHGGDVALSKKTGIAPLVEKVKELSYDDIRAGLSSRLSSAAGAFQITALPEGSTSWAGSSGAAGVIGSERTPTHQLRDDWKISSFSYITAGSVSGYEPRSDESHDPSRSEGKGFPAGADPGSCLHEILEKTPFNADDDSIRGCAATVLERWNIDPVHCDAAVRLVRNTLSSPLNQEIVLSDVSDASCLKELEFYFPAALIDAEGLKDLFARHASSFRYGETGSLASLSFQEFSGFLKGFIDCLFEYKGRYYVVDWKSNWLGDSPEKYDAASLGRAMDHHRYTLQGHIYALASHRYLSQRIPGYSYDRDFGGVFYLFMRGLDPEHAGNGVWFTKPSSAMMDDLEGFFLRSPEVTV